MSASAAYLDTSAFVKLLVAEPESAALRARLARWPDRVSATLLRTETVRALRRSGNEHLIGSARRLFRAILLIRLDEPLLDRAGDLGPAELRSLDSVHLAAALSVGTDLGVMITYDDRLREAALAQGLDVESPS
ncbi:MAG: type II toxin-antitoxin system VapC family toxin [Nocardioidaceae bacterium]|jgi:predicted nucleic acid-binding protein|nr:type II toxin-antitoxin system VapC family toxin [Nocardioidaceae bacterium]